jgi:uncharacterized membrane protein
MNFGSVRAYMHYIIIVIVLLMILNNFLSLCSLHVHLVILPSLLGIHLIAVCLVVPHLHQQERSQQVVTAQLMLHLFSTAPTLLSVAPLTHSAATLMLMAPTPTQICLLTPQCRFPQMAAIWEGPLIVKNL